MLKFENDQQVYLEQPILTAAMSAIPYSEEAVAKCKFVTKFDEHVDMGVRVGNTLWVPRNLAPIGAEDHRVSYPPVAINCNFKPRDEEQATLIPKSVELLKKGKNHLFCAPTGWGKTWAGTVIAAMMGQPTMILVNKEDLLNQWRETFQAAGIPTNKIGHVQQDICDWKGKQIVTGMVHSIIAPERYPKDMYNYFGLVEWDEADAMATDCFIRSCQMFPAMYRLGLSATPERTDGKSKMLKAHIGPVMVTGTIIPMSPKILVVNTGWRIPTVRKVINGEVVYQELPYSPGQMTVVIKAMASDRARNQQIISFTKAALDNNRTTLLLSDLIEGHLDILFKQMTHCGMPGEGIGYYVGGMSDQELTLTKKRRIVLGTYKMVARGTNVPHWDSLVMCTPRSNIAQPMGRVLRSMNGKLQPLILDLVDWNSIFKSFHLNRLKQYYAVGATIVKMG